MAHVLVTGSAGTAGRPLCKELRRRGHVVRVFERVPTPDVADASAADVADAAAVHAAMRGIDALVHLAAQPREQAVKRVVERRPNHHHALAKVWAEEMGELYARRFGLSVLVVRLGWMVRDPDEARHRQELGIFDCYVSRGGERVFDMAPARRLLGFEAEQRWPEGLPFPLPQRDG